MRKNFINRKLFNNARQDCTLFTLMLILYVYIVCHIFIVYFA